MWTIIIFSSCFFIFLIPFTFYHFYQLLTQHPQHLPFHIKLRSYLVKKFIPIFGYKFIRFTETFSGKPKKSNLHDFYIEKMIYFHPLKNEKIELSMNVYKSKTIENENENEKELSIFCFFFGGGCVVGHSNRFDNFFVEIIKKNSSNVNNNTRMMIISPNYHKCPEFKYQEIMVECEEFVKWIGKKYPKKRIILCGESAGGTICIYLSRYLRDNNYQFIEKRNLFFIPIYPDIALDDDDAIDKYKSRQEFFKNGLIVDHSQRSYFRKFHGKRQLFDMNDIEGFKNLPSHLIVTAEYCFFKDEGKEYFDILKSNNSEEYMEYLMFENEVHGFVSPFVSVSKTSYKILIEKIFENFEKRFFSDGHNDVEKVNHKKYCKISQ